jgi:hypothetical protein
MVLRSSLSLLNSRKAFAWGIMLAAVVTIPTVMRLASIRPMPPRIMWLTRRCRQGNDQSLSSRSSRATSSRDNRLIFLDVNLKVSWPIRRRGMANPPMSYTSRESRTDHSVQSYPHTRPHTTKRVITPKHWRRGTRLATLPGLPLADRAIGEMAYMLARLSLKRSFWEVQTASLWPGSVDEPTA